MPLTDDTNVHHMEDQSAAGSLLRVSRSSGGSQCLPSSLSPNVTVSYTDFDLYKRCQAPDAAESGTVEDRDTLLASCQTSGAVATRRWTKSDFMRLRTLARCSIVPPQLQRGLLRAPALAMREKADGAPAAPVEGRNPRTVDVRFVRDEIVSVTDANAYAWRKKSTPTYPETSAARMPPGNSVDSGSRDWRGRRLTPHDGSWEHESASGAVVGDDWLMPTGAEDYDLGKNDVEMFEKMRKQARMQWAGAEPIADSETEDVLHQLMAESTNESTSDENKGNGHSSQASLQIDVQALFMDAGAQNISCDDANRDGTENSAQTGASNSIAMMGPGQVDADRDASAFVHTGAAQAPGCQDAVDASCPGAPVNASSTGDHAQQHHNSSSAELGGSELGADAGSIWGAGGMGSGRLAQDAPVSEVDWKMMREIWNRPSNAADGVQQQMQGMHLVDSCIGSGQNGNFFGSAPQSQQQQQHAVDPAADSRTGIDAGGEANAMKVLMQLWNTSSEASTSSQAPAQAKSAAEVLNAQQDLSQQLIAFHHQQQQQKQQHAQRQAAVNSTGLISDQMLEQRYLQRPTPVAHDRAREPVSSDMYTHAMSHAGHGAQQHMANYAYARHGGKPVQQDGMNGQYSSQAHQLATVLWFQASMAQASQAAQTQRHQQQGHSAASRRRPAPQDMLRGSNAPANSHSAAAFLQQLQQGSGSAQLSNDQYSAAAAAAVAAAQQQNLTQTVRGQVYNSADRKQHPYAPVQNSHMMRPSQGHSSQQGSAQVPNYAESVVRAMLLPTAARQHQAQQMSQYYRQQSQTQAHPRYNNSAGSGLHMQQQHSSAQHGVAHNGFAHAPGSGVVPNNFSHLYDAGRMHR